MRFHQDNLIFLLKQLYPFLNIFRSLFPYNISITSTEMFLCIILKEIFIIYFLILKVSYGNNEIYTI